MPKPCVKKYNAVGLPVTRNDFIWSPINGQAEDNSLGESETSRIILALISDGVITTNNEGMITYTNPAAEVMTGWQATEALGRPFREVFRVINENDQELTIAADRTAADYSNAWENLVLVTLLSKTEYDVGSSEGVGYR